MHSCCQGRWLVLHPADASLKAGHGFVLGIAHRVDWSNSKFAILKIDGLIGRRRAHSLWKTRSLLQLLPFAIEKNIRPSWAMRSQSQLNHYDAVKIEAYLNCPVDA